MAKLKRRLKLLKLIMANLKRRLRFILAILTITLGANTFIFTVSVLNRNNDTSEQKKRLFTSQSNYTYQRLFVTCRYEIFNLSNPFKTSLSNSSMGHVISGNHTDCVLEGTSAIIGHQCLCKSDWHGPACGFPEGLRLSETKMNMSNLVLRKSARRIIHAFPFNIEFDMLETRFAELGSVVDAFIILESNYTAAGQPKPLRLLDNLRHGYFKSIQDKIVYVYLDYFPEAAFQNGWVIDDLLRDHIGLVGMNQLLNVRKDDIFLLSDADELPRKNEVLFLKLYDGYPEPVGFHLHFTAYGFFYSPLGRPTIPIYMAVTVEFLYEIYEGKASRVRNPAKHLHTFKNHVSTYESSGHRVQEWFLGHAHSEHGQVGWHCSWCFRIDGIRLKLVSAQLSDTPRWGNYPEKLKSGYIRSIIVNGSWFNGRKAFKYIPRNSTMYAPDYVLSNPVKFDHLLRNTYVNDTAQM